MRNHLLLPLLVACTNGGRPVGVGKDADDTDTSGVDSADSDGDDSGDSSEPVEPADPCPPHALGARPPEVAWTWGADGARCLATPVVGDLDGDGLPEIVVVVVRATGFLTTASTTLAALRGDGSGTLFEVPVSGVAYGSTPALADLDGDGTVEVLTVHNAGASDLLSTTTTYSVQVRDSSGGVREESAGYPKVDFDYATALSVANVDGKSGVEVVAGRLTLGGGLVPLRLESQGKGSWGRFAPSLAEGAASLVADADGDGIAEVWVGNAAYLPDKDPLPTGSAGDGFVALVDLDADPALERVISTLGAVSAQDDDGTPLWGPDRLQCSIPSCANDTADPLPKGAGLTGPFAVGDLDGEPGMEIVVAGGSELVAFRRDGTRLWTATTRDDTGGTTPTLADLDGDGRLEVLHGDQEGLLLLEGATGKVLHTLSERRSVTMFEAPTVADVDRDGHAEIVLCRSGTGPPVVVLEASDGDWAPTRAVWNQHAYVADGIDDLLRVPDAPWQPQRSPELRVATPVPHPERVSGSVSKVSVTRASCSAEAVVTFQVENRGGRSMPPGIPVAVYTEADGSRRARATVVTLGAQAPLGVQQVQATVPAERLAGRQRVVVRFDDSGGGSAFVDQCDWGNDEAAAALPDCP